MVHGLSLGANTLTEVQAALLNLKTNPDPEIPKDGRLCLLPETASFWEAIYARYKHQWVAFVVCSRCQKRTPISIQQV